MTQDQFEIAYSDYSNQSATTAVAFASISPALTPTSLLFVLSSVQSSLIDLENSGGYPAFKMYDIDPDTYEIMDVKVYMSQFTFPLHRTNTNLCFSKYV